MSPILFQVENCIKCGEPAQPTRPTCGSRNCRTLWAIDTKLGNVVMQFAKKAQQLKKDKDTEGHH